MHKARKNHSTAFVLDDAGEFELVHCARTSWGQVKNFTGALLRSQLSNLKIQTHSLIQIDNLFLFSAQAVLPFLELTYSILVLKLGFLDLRILRGEKWRSIAKCISEKISKFAIDCEIILLPSFIK